MSTPTAPVIDPKNPNTKPHGLSTVAPRAKVDTTDDQAKEMESEGQAKTSQDTPEDAPAGTPVRSSLDKTMSDQDIDTAGTDADKA